MVLFCSDRPAIKAGLFSFGHMKWPGEWHHRAEGRGWVGNNMYFYITAEFGRDSLVRREAALEMPALPNDRVIILWISPVKLKSL